MVKKTIRLCVLAIAAVLAIMFCSTISNERSHAADAAQQESHDDRKAMESPKSSPLALLAHAYEESGYTSEQSIAIAHRLLGKTYEDVPMPAGPVAGKTLESPKSNPLAVLAHVYEESGWSPQEAIDIAAAALGLPDDPAKCIVYDVRIVYCDPVTGARMAVSAYMNANCWDDPDQNPATNDGLNQCEFTCVCPTGRYKWLQLRVAAHASCRSLPAAGTCVMMHVNPSLKLVDCSEVGVECSCFQETSPVDCSQIECCCCASARSGCTECPSCSEPCPKP